MENNSMVAKCMIITGSVHGVFFRRNAKERADVLKIRGWVRNTNDGNVEIHAEGSPQALEQLQAWCHKGPPAAHVEHVIVEDVPEEHFTSFAVLQ